MMSRIDKSVRMGLHAMMRKENCLSHFIIRIISFIFKRNSAGTSGYNSRGY